jgi:hypothetical protein
MNHYPRKNWKTLMFLLVTSVFISSVFIGKTVAGEDDKAARIARRKAEKAANPKQTTAQRAQGEEAVDPTKKKGEEAVDPTKKKRSKVDTFEKKTSKPVVAPAVAKKLPNKITVDGKTYNLMPPAKNGKSQSYVLNGDKANFKEPHLTIVNHYPVLEMHFTTNSGESDANKIKLKQMGEGEKIMRTDGKLLSPEYKEQGDKIIDEFMKEWNK